MPTAKSILDQLRLAEQTSQFLGSFRYWPEYKPDNATYLGTVDANEDLAADTDQYIYDVYALNTTKELFCYTDGYTLIFDDCEGVDTLEARFPPSRYRYLNYAPES